MKEKKIRKQKALQAIKESEPLLTIPRSWKLVRLGNLVSILGDGIHGTPNYFNDGEYYFVNGNNLQDGKIVIKENTKKTSVGEYEKYRKPLTSRTIFVSINGTLGNVAFYNNEPIVLGKSASYFNLLQGIDKYYIKILIESKYFLDYAFRSATGTTIKNVSLKSMRNLPVPLPPLAEQKRIVKKIDELMVVCDELEESIKESQKYSELLMKAVLREAFETEKVEVSL